MRNAYIADNGYGRLCDQGKLGDLSPAAHSHFDNSRSRVLVKSHQGTGQTDVVIEIALCLERIEFFIENAPGHFLCRGLADASRQSDNRNIEGIPEPMSKSHKSFVRIINPDNHAVGINIVMYHRRRSSVLKCGSGERVSVKVFALNCNIKTTRLAES